MCAKGFVLSLLIGCCLLGTVNNASGVVVDFIAVTMVPASQYFDSTTGNGEFGVGLTSAGQTFQMQAGAAVVGNAAYTAYAQTAAELTSDTSSGNMASGIFDNKSSAGVVSTLTIEGVILNLDWSAIIYTGPILVAEAIGPATAAEVDLIDPTGDQIQYQQLMQVTGGELLNGAVTGLTMLSTFTVTYTFDKSWDMDMAPGNVEIDDFSKDIFYTNGQTNVLLNPEPVSIILMGVGSILALRSRRNRR